MVLMVLIQPAESGQEEAEEEEDEEEEMISKSSNTMLTRVGCF